MDLILLKTPDPIPSQFRLKTTVLAIDLAEEPPPPVVGERIFYGGFPRLLGRDTTLKQNYPLVMDGIVSQVVPADPYFIVQAPVFSGASGSPILSQKDGHFLGVLFGTIPEQESFLYAVKASVLSAWIKDIIFKRK